MTLRFALIPALATCLVALSSLAANAAGVSITDGWFRALPAPLPAGGYFTLHNDGDKAVTLTGAQSPACGTLMIHQSMDHGGMTMMMPVTKVAIQPGGTLAFAPGGYHLMCTETKPVLKPGASVPVTLNFDGAQSVTADFSVRGAAGK